MYRVYHDCNHIFTTPSVGRAVVMVAAQLEWYRARSFAVEAKLLELDAVALLDEDSALLAPWILPYKVPEIELRARGAGRRLLEGSSVFVDPETAELVVPSVPLLTAAGSGRQADPLDGAARESTAPGRWPITTWHFLAQRGALSELSRSQAVARAMGVAYRHHQPAENLRMLANLVRRTEVLSAQDIDGLVGVVTKR